MTTRTRRRGFLTALTALAASAALMMGGSPASAQTTNVDYDANGTTTIASNGSTITLGPAVMNSRVETDGTFTGDMALPGAHTSFKVIGFVPVSANVNFEPVGPTTGVLIRSGRNRILESESQYYVRLSNIKVAGIPTLAGSNCRTADPVVVPADTPDGEFFNIASGGRLVGEYSIGNFKSCGLLGAQTHLINALIPGGGNTIELNLTDGRAVN